MPRPNNPGFHCIPSGLRNWDVPADRKLILDHAWSPRSGLVVFYEIHKMRGWKSFLKGAWDGRGEGQAMLVTGSARMEAFRQGGESLAGRYFAWRLHPFSLRELVETKGMTPQDALDRLLERGGFPEPCLAEDARDADRWRASSRSSRNRARKPSVDAWKSRRRRRGWRNWRRELSVRPHAMRHIDRVSEALIYSPSVVPNPDYPVRGQAAAGTPLNQQSGCPPSRA